MKCTTDGSHGFIWWLTWFHLICFRNCIRRNTLVLFLLQAEKTKDYYHIQLVQSKIPLSTSTCARAVVLSWGEGRNNQVGIWRAAGGALNYLVQCRFIKVTLAFRGCWEFELVLLQKRQFENIIVLKINEILSSFSMSLFSYLASIPAVWKMQFFVQQCWPDVILFWFCIELAAKATCWNINAQR